MASLDRDLLLKEISRRIDEGLPPDNDPEKGPLAIKYLHAAGDSLLLAAKYNSTAILNKILSHPQCSALLHHTNAKSETLLHIAAKAGHLDLVKALLSRDRDAGEGRQAKRLVEMRSRGGNTALHEAVRSKSPEVVETIADEGKEMIAAANDEGRSPLYFAVDMGFVQGVRTMLKKEPAASGQTGPGGRSLLHAAVTSRNLDVAEILLDQAQLAAGVNDDEGAPSPARVRDDKGQNSMHYATTNGSLQAVKLLLRRDRSAAYEVDSRGRLPIHLAAIHGREDMVREIFLNCPDSADLLDGRERNILHLAVENERQDVVAYILQESELRLLLNERDDNGDSPMHLAVKKINIPLLYLICSRPGVDKGIMNKKGQTAIDIAESIKDPYMKLEKIRMIRALKYAGVPRGKHEEEYQDVISSSTHDDPVINSSNDGRGAGHDQNERVGRGTESDPGKHEEEQGQVISSSTHDHPVINSSNNGRSAGHDQNRRGGRGTEIDSDKYEEDQGKDVISSSRHDLLINLPNNGKDASPGRKRRDRGTDNDPEETTSTRSLKSRANTLSLLAILIATVTFAAAFTMPGGYEQDGPNKGAPVWATRPAFKVFLIANTLAMTISVAEAIILIWASASDRRLLVFTVKFCQSLAMVAVLAMIVAFVTGVYVVMAGRSKRLAIFICVLGPGVFFLLLSPLFSIYQLTSMKSASCANLELTELYCVDYYLVLSFNDLDGDYNADVKSFVTTIAVWYFMLFLRLSFRVASCVKSLYFFKQEL